MTGHPAHHAPAVGVIVSEISCTTGFPVASRTVSVSPSAYVNDAVFSVIDAEI